MFHYCITQGRRLQDSLPPSGLRPSESAACGCNKSTMKDEQRRLSTTDTSQSGDSSLFVLVRPLSCLFAFIPPESSLFACNLTGSSGILLLQCAFATDRPPELVALVEALTLRKGVFQLKGRLLKAVRSELRAAKESGLTWRVIWGTLREEGYPGGYQQFCKAANRVIEGTQPHIARKPKNLPPLWWGKRFVNRWSARAA